MNRGFTVVESLIALVLTVVLLTAAGVLLRGQLGIARRIRVDADILLAFRITRSTLEEEVHYGHAGRDWIAEADTLGVRSFRGTAVVCGTPALGQLSVRYSGWRDPNPAKDSVLVLTHEGRWTAVALSGRGPHGPMPQCGDSTLGRPELWSVEPAVEGVLGRLFERGSYHLTGQALRYRRGGGGRQPITPGVFSRMGLTRSLPDSALSVRLEAPGGRVLIPGSWRIATDEAF